MGLRFICVFDCALKSLGNVCLYFLISGYNNNASKKHKFTSINKELWRHEAEEEEAQKHDYYTRECMCAWCVCVCVFVPLPDKDKRACKANGGSSMRHVECCVLCLNCALKSACLERVEPGAKPWPT